MHIEWYFVGVIPAMRWHKIFLSADGTVVGVELWPSCVTVVVVLGGVFAVGMVLAG